MQEAKLLSRNEILLQCQNVQTSNHFRKMTITCEKSPLSGEFTTHVKIYKTELQSAELWIWRDGKMQEVGRFYECLAEAQCKHYEPIN
jgi:hypothetical protein